MQHLGQQEFESVPVIGGKNDQTPQYVHHVNFVHMHSSGVRGWESSGTAFVQGSYARAEELILEHKLQRAFDVSLATKWRRNVTDPKSSVDVDAISVTMDSVFEWMALWGPESINLGSMVETDVQGEHLAAVLRATSSWSDVVPGWGEALAHARKALAYEGVDPEDALYGLI